MLMRCVLLLAALACSGAHTGAHAGTLPLAACDAPVHSPQATRYELQGTTELTLNVLDSGKAANVYVTRSSGWKMLDADAVKLAATCRFPQNSPSGTLEVPWVLPSSTLAPVRPQLIADSCKATKLFKPGKAGAVETLQVRLQVWTDGVVYAPQLETGTSDPTIDSAAIALAQRCRYTPAQRDGAPVNAAAVLDLGLDLSALEEPALRAFYDQNLPGLKRRLENQREFLAAHILLPDEAAARKAMAALLGGEPFADLAARLSPDSKVKDGGSLGWGLASYYTPPFAAALERATTPAMVPEPVKTRFGWHIIRIDDIRPAQPPTFETVRKVLRRAVINGTTPISVATVSPTGAP